LLPDAIAVQVNGILEDEFHLDAVLSFFGATQQGVVRAIHTFNSRRPRGSLHVRTPTQVIRRTARPGGRPSPA
jgi:hypothetical protein